jgi:hypothetical protein
MHCFTARIAPSMWSRLVVAVNFNGSPPTEGMQSILLELVQRPCLGFPQFVHSGQILGLVYAGLYLFEQANQLHALNLPTLHLFVFRAALQSDAPENLPHAYRQ